MPTLYQELLDVAEITMNKSKSMFGSQLPRWLLVLLPPPHPCRHIHPLSVAGLTDSPLVNRLRQCMTWRLGL